MNSDSDVEILESAEDSLDQTKMDEEDPYNDSEYEYEYQDSDEDEQPLSFAEAPVLDVSSESRQHIAYTIITPQRLAKKQADAMQEVNNILGCTTHEARRLLMYSNWNLEALFGAITSSSQERVNKLAGLPDAVTAECTTTSGDAEIECKICYCDVPQSDALTMDCGHVFCKDCWGQHFKIGITEGASRNLKCMQEKCGIICEETKVRSVIAGEPELLKKYNESLDASYVEDNSNVCWCPSVPHCGNAIKAEKDTMCEPACSCGHKFCFACGLEPHSPCTCDMWSKWKQKCNDDSETKNWLVANTKPCPKCGKSVEKNGGCNLVYCKCGQTFCWLCGTATGSAHTWTEIHGHKCGTNKKDMDQKIDEASRNVKRYLSHFEHWTQLNLSAAEEKKAGKAAIDKLSELESAGASMCVEDYTQVVQAYKQLHEVREILANSYVFAFYMFSSMYKEEIPEAQCSIMQNLFELTQQDLAAAVEHTSRLLTNVSEDMENITPETRLEIINITKNLDRRVQNMYELVENDILSQLTYSPSTISFYKGVRPKRARVSDNAMDSPSFFKHTQDSALPAKKHRSGTWSALKNIIM